MCFKLCFRGDRNSDGHTHAIIAVIKKQVTNRLNPYIFTEIILTKKKYIIFLTYHAAGVMHASLCYKDAGQKSLNF
jgi:hypothetical protein